MSTTSIAPLIVAAGTGEAAAAWARPRTCRRRQNTVRRSESPGLSGTRVPAESLSAIGMHVHETTDPEVVIAEFRYEGTCEGRPFSWPCIFVTRVRDSLIVESRDYTDHVGAARAFGGLDALAAALTAR